MTETPAAKPDISPALRMAIDFGPLATFFIANALAPEPKLLKVFIATGAFIFSRIFGQALGAAAFGGILNLGLARYLQGEGDLLTRILTPEQRATLPADTLAPLMQEFSHALHIVFIILAALAVATLAIGYMLPKGRSIRR